MTVAAFLPCLLLFLNRLSIGSSYSFNIDTDVKTSSKITYSSGHSGFGTALDASQDFNGDGFNDILACSSSNNNAYLFFGGVSGASTTPSIVFTGPASSMFSSGCRYAGDVNKDGYADIIFGAPSISSDTGAAYLVLGGPSTTTPFAVPASNGRTITYTPESSNGAFGWSTAGVGDVNKDTFDDFVICARYFDSTLTDVGACYLIYGGTSLQSKTMTSLGSGGIRITGTIANQKLGQAVAGVGDINKDGYVDILISCGDLKNVYLLYGGPSLTNVDTTPGSFHGVIFPNPTATFDVFGASVSGAGDFNGDGYDDLMISSYSMVTNCQIYIVFGSSSLPASFNLNSMTSSTGVRYFTGKNDGGGYSVSGGVDVNRDGFDDVIIGALYANDLDGMAHVVFGSVSPVDSSVFQLGNGVISLNATLNIRLGYAVTLEKDVGTNTRGFLVTGLSGSANPVYYFHDLFGTTAPSVSPTTAPTLSPTSPPSFAPSSTDVPSAVPSEGPTATPTMTPSVGPSVTPTFTPTRYPSVVPSNSPTVIPTMTPTLAPSVTPTFTPTRSPSVVPSNSPTVTPTMTPTLVPSVTPSFTHTRSPTVVPSESPTLTPTDSPTFVPSADPTMTPSEVPTVVPSFRPSAPTYSPSAVPTPVPTGRSKSSIVVSAGFTMNSVNGATLTPTSQETIKQSIANVSQATVNNVDLVSVTRTNRRLLLSSSSSSSSSVVHRMLASVPLFSYKVVAEMHFNLIDFPGLNESYVAGTKSKVLVQSMESHEFDRIISYYAIVNNATQLMSNVTVFDVTVTTSTIPAPDDSSSGSKEDLTVGEIVGIVVGAIAGACLLTVLIYLAVVQRKSQSKARRIIPKVEPDNKLERVPLSDNAVVDIAKVYEDSSDKQLDRLKKQQMTTSTSPDVVKLY
jgi:hypothetical protein